MRKACSQIIVTMSSGPIEIASTIQTAHINRAPSPHHDINPSTSSSTKIPVHIRSPSSPPSSPSAIPLRPRRRKPTMPPLPDLRFEQSYLASLPPGASWSRIAYITIRDQLFAPLLQGIIWSLALSGWRHWNRATNLKGQTLGARFRRWWWEVNNWKLPETR
jgi:hypothetical protein